MVLFGFLFEEPPFVRFGKNRIDERGIDFRNRMSPPLVECARATPRRGGRGMTFPCGEEVPGVPPVRARERRGRVSPGLHRERRVFFRGGVRRGRAPYRAGFPVRSTGGRGGEGTGISPGVLTARKSRPVPCLRAAESVRRGLPPGAAVRTDLFERGDDRRRISSVKYASRRRASVPVRVTRTS